LANESSPSRTFLLDAERRVLRYCLSRHADSKYSTLPRQAEPLDPNSAQRSATLWFPDAPQLQKWDLKQYCVRTACLVAIVKDHEGSDPNDSSNA
jgi:hypothetical protein